MVLIIINESLYVFSLILKATKIMHAILLLIFFGVPHSAICTVFSFFSIIESTRVYSGKIN